MMRRIFGYFSVFFGLGALVFIGLMSVMNNEPNAKNTKDFAVGSWIMSVSKAAVTYEKAKPLEEVKFHGKVGITGSRCIKWQDYEKCGRIYAISKNNITLQELRLNDGKCQILSEPIVDENLPLKMKQHDYIEWPINLKEIKGYECVISTVDVKIDGEWYHYNWIKKVWVVS